MSDYLINDTDCVLTRSHITGDVLCRHPGDECDCLMVRHDMPDFEADGHRERHAALYDSVRTSSQAGLASIREGIET